MRGESALLSLSHMLEECFCHIVVQDGHGLSEVEGDFFVAEILGKIPVTALGNNAGIFGLQGVQRNI